MPDNPPSTPRGKPQTEEGDDQTKKADGSVLPGVICGFLRYKGPNENHTNSQQRGAGDPQILWDETDKRSGCVVPYPVRRRGDGGNGDIEEDEPQCKGQIYQEGDEPAQIVAMQY